MRKIALIADENVPQNIVSALRDAGFYVISVQEISPGISDMAVSRLADDKQRAILTFDLDFGRMTFVEGTGPKCGVVIGRFSNSADFQGISSRICTVLDEVENLHGKLIVIRDDSFRIRMLPQ